MFKVRSSFQRNRLYIYVCLIFWQDVLVIWVSFLCPEVGIPASLPNPSTSNKATTISHSTSVGLDISLSTLVVGLLPRICRLRHPDLVWRALRRTELHLLRQKSMRQSSTSLSLYSLSTIRPAWIEKSLGRRYCRQCFLRRRGMALLKPLLGQLPGCQHSELPIDLQKSHNDGIGP